MMIGYNTTVTVYHKQLTDETAMWTPTTVNGAYVAPVKAINPGSTTTSSAPATLFDFPTDVWDRIRDTAAGDYIVIGKCTVEAFTGNAAVKLIPVGGRQIESISEYLYVTPVDHVEVVAR